MNIGKAMLRTSLIAVFVALSFSLAFAGKKKEERVSTKEQSRIVDSGSFGVFVNGSRVATETFKIEQRESESLINSEFSTDGEGVRVRQSAELRMAPNGDLRRYSWREQSPGKEQLTVEPSSEFLIEHIIPDPPDKPSNVPLLVSSSTAVLDDYFFSHREALIWRYMAQNCGATIHSDCTMAKVQFGAIVPQERSTASVSVEYQGKEKVIVKGAEETLDRFNLDVEGDLWVVYLDTNMKMIKIVIPSDKTEVIRD
jgi:hypothetical protein